MAQATVLQPSSWYCSTGNVTLCFGEVEGATETYAVLATFVNIIFGVSWTEFICNVSSLWLRQ
jgi:hypothetical protein